MFFEMKVCVEGKTQISQIAQNSKDRKKPLYGIVSKARETTQSKLVYCKSFVKYYKKYPT